MAMEEEVDEMASLSHPLVLDCDMDEEERAEAVEIVVTAIEKFPADLEKACKFVKDDMDKKFGQHFHCIIGQSFGYSADFELRHKLAMCFGAMGVLLYKSS